MSNFNLIQVPNPGINGDTGGVTLPLPSGVIGNGNGRIAPVNPIGGGNQIVSLPNTSTGLPIPGVPEYNVDPNSGSSPDQASIFFSLAAASFCVSLILLGILGLILPDDTVSDLKDQAVGTVKESIKGLGEAAVVA